MVYKYFFFLLFFSFIIACQPEKRTPKTSVVKTLEPEATVEVDSIYVNEKLSKGKLFLIGGGDRPLSMMETMVRSAEVDTTDFIAVLTMANLNPDSAFQDVNQQFLKLGYNHAVH